MKQPLALLAAAALSLAALFPCAADDKSAAQLVIEIPAAVQATVTAEKGDGRVEAFQRLNESDGSSYRVGLLIDGAHYALTLDAGGRVMRKELDELQTEAKPAPLETLPAAVRKAFQRESHGTPPAQVEVETEHTHYLAEVTFDGRKYRLRLDATGKLLLKETIQE